MIRSRSLHVFSFTAVALVGFAFVFPRTANAFENQSQIGIGAEYSSLLGNPSTIHGFGGGVHLSHGLDDLYNFIAIADSFYYPSKNRLGLGGAVGLGYLVDTIQYVPYVGILTGGYYTQTISGPCDGVDQPVCGKIQLSIAIHFGIDWNVTRSFMMGIGGRYQVLLGAGGTEVALMTGLKVGYVWGF